MRFSQWKSEPQSQKNTRSVDVDAELLVFLSVEERRRRRREKIAFLGVQNHPKIIKKHFKNSQCKMCITWGDPPRGVGGGGGGGEGSPFRFFL